MDVGMVIVEPLGARLDLSWMGCICKNCEMSGSLFRIKNLKYFRNFLKNSGDCSYIASTILLVNQIVQTFFFCCRQLCTILIEYSSSAALSSPLSAYFFSGGGGRRWCLFTGLFFNHFLNFWIIIGQTIKFFCRQGHCLITLKHDIFNLFIQLYCDICTHFVKRFRSNPYNAFFSRRYILKIIVKVCIIF